MQDHLKYGIPSRHPIIAWVVEHAGELLSSFQIGPHGRTAYEGARGKPSRRSLVEFGEKVHYRTGKLDSVRKIEPRWAVGFVLGLGWW